jgi:hypothetical protein
MISAALTLARAWHVEGRPDGDRTLGMFEKWAKVIGGILKVAGCHDFLDNLVNVYDEADTEGDAARWFFEEWVKHHGDKPARISDTAGWALASMSPVAELMQANKDARMAYSAWVRNLKGRVVEVNGRPTQLQLVKANVGSRSQTWRMSSLSGQRPLFEGQPATVGADVQADDVPF